MLNYSHVIVHFHLNFGTLWNWTFCNCVWMREHLESTDLRKGSWHIFYIQMQALDARALWNLPITILQCENYYFIEFWTLWNIIGLQWPNWSLWSSGEKYIKYRMQYGISMVIHHKWVLFGFIFSSILSSFVYTHSFQFGLHIIALDWLSDNSWPCLHNMCWFVHIPAVSPFHNGLIEMLNCS